MKLNYLLPHRFKKIGWIVLIPSLILAIPSLIMQYEPTFLTVQMPTLIHEGLLTDPEYFTLAENNIFAELTGILIIIGSLFVAFSKEKQEDELISKIRLESLVWAVLLNYGVMLLALLFISGFAFAWVMVLNIFTILLFFILRFHWQISLFNSTLHHAE